MSIKRLFVAQPLDILGSVRIDMLQRSRELVIKPLDHGNDAARDFECFTSYRLRWLLIIFPFLGILEDHHVTVALKLLEKSAVFLLSPV